MGGTGRRQAALATFTGAGTTIAITVAQAFLLVPLCLRYLGTPLYGAWLGASEWLVWIQLLDIGLPNLVTQRVGAAVGRADPGEAARWSSTGFVLLSGVAACLLMVGYGVAPLVTVWARVGPHDAATFTTCFRLGAMGSAVLLLFNGCVGLSRGVQRTVAVNVGQVGGAVVGLAVSIVLLLTGWGLWALALGLLSRALVSLAGGVFFVWSLPRTHGSWLAGPSRPLAREAVGLAPAMAAASAGYVLANNAEILLVTTIFGPVPAAVYALTRRAIDGLRRLLDAVSWAVYGGFAHLVTARDRHRARRVLQDVLFLQLSMACVVGAAIVAVNPTFVRFLFGANNFGGLWLSGAFAVQTAVGGQSLLANFLYRACGYVREGSHLLALEAAFRVGTMCTGLYGVGLAGAPTASALVGSVMLVVLARRLDAVLPADESERAKPSRRPFVPVAVLLTGFVLAATWHPQSWRLLIATGAIVTIAGGAAVWTVLPPGLGHGTLLAWIRPSPPRPPEDPRFHG